MPNHITGKQGLVGSALSEQIKTSVEYNDKINSYNVYYNFLKNNNIHTIYHTAAKVGGVLANYENKIEFCLENLKLNNIVFEAAYNLKIKNLINYSSTCIFPDQIESNTKPLTENVIFNGPPHFSNDGYAYAKRMMQYLCSEARKKNLNFFSIVSTNIFGPNDNYSLTHAHVIPALIHKCYEAKKNNIDLVVWGDGAPLREFIYSKDLAKISTIILEKNHDYDSIIVSNSQEYSIKECAEIIAKAFDFKGKIIFDIDKPKGQYQKPTDTSLLKSLIGNFQFTDFEIAIKESVEWFVNNKNFIKEGRI
jgi:GDP-L-fucose synthase